MQILRSPKCSRSQILLWSARTKLRLLAAIVCSWYRTEDRVRSRNTKPTCAELERDSLDDDMPGSQTIKARVTSPDMDNTTSKKTLPHSCVIMLEPVKRSPTASRGESSTRSRAQHNGLYAHSCGRSCALLERHNNITYDNMITCHAGCYKQVMRKDGRSRFDE